jgi:hypothetical protein
MTTMLPSPLAVSAALRLDIACSIDERSDCSSVRNWTLSTVVVPSETFAESSLIRWFVCATCCRNVSRRSCASWTAASAEPVRICVEYFTNSCAT